MSQKERENSITIKRQNISVNDTENKKANSALSAWLEENRSSYIEEITKTLKNNDREEFYRLVEMIPKDELYNTVKETSFKAAEYGRDEELNYLLTLGAKCYGMIAIHAAKGGHLDIVLGMIDVKFDYNGKRIGGASNWNRIACAAASNGHPEIVRKMIEKGARGWNTISYGAARYGDKKLLDELIELGASKWNEMIRGAARGGHSDIVLDMVERGADDINSAALEAAKGGHKDLLISLVGFGACNWIELISIAEKNKHSDIADYIRDY